MLLIGINRSKRQNIFFLSTLDMLEKLTAMDIGLMDE
jgi:hypothetical protein